MTDPERIAQLEKENAALKKELLESQSEMAQLRSTIKNLHMTIGRIVKLWMRVSPAGFKPWFKGEDEKNKS